MTEWFVSQPRGSEQSDIAQGLFTLAVDTAEQAPEQVLLYWILTKLYDQEHGVLNELQQVDWIAYIILFYLNLCSQTLDSLVVLEVSLLNLILSPDLDRDVYLLLFLVLFVQVIQILIYFLPFIKTS